MKSQDLPKLSPKKLLLYWSILILILSSGNLYFTILNMRLTLILMAVTAIMLILKFGFHISKRNFIVVLSIAILIFLNYIINSDRGIAPNDLILLVARLVFLIILQENVSVQNFKRCYVNIMTVEAVVSLLCFVSVNVVGMTRLPFEFTAVGDMNGYYLSLYYTIGWFNYPIFDRNAGFFWEPGAHQIFLNLAILFLIIDINNPNNLLEKSSKNNFIKIILLIVTVLTTQSTTGYMCLATILVSSIFINGDKDVSRKLKFTMLVALLVFIFIEIRYGIISYKLKGGGSYETRITETYTGLKLANENWMFGVGFLRSNRDYIGANGLFSIIVSLGYPTVIIYLLATFVGIKKLLEDKIIISLFAFAFYIMSLSSESIAPLTIFLSFLFDWKKDIQYEKEQNRQYIGEWNE